MHGVIAAATHHAPPPDLAVACAVLHDTVEDTATTGDDIAARLADRIVNLSPPPADWSSDKRCAYQAEARDILAALAEASPYLAKRLDARITAYSAFITPCPGHNGSS